MSTARNRPRKTAQRRDLTVEKIVDATLAVLKSGDPAALTMRRVAEQCGVSAMAIYHHVNDKEELANLAVDSLFLKACAEVRGDGTWRERALDMWVTIRRYLLDTPGAGAIFLRRAIIGPGTAKATEDMFALLAEAGLTSRQIAETADAMTMLSIGSIANELTRPKQIRDRLAEQLPAKDTPQIQAHLSSYSNRDGTERYMLALGWILDGVEARVQAARAPGGPP